MLIRDFGEDTSRQQRLLGLYGMGKKEELAADELRGGLQGKIGQRCPNWADWGGLREWAASEIGGLRE